MSAADVHQQMQDLRCDTLAKLEYLLLEFQHSESREYARREMREYLEKLEPLKAEYAKQLELEYRAELGRGEP